jgi:hypothetical protein
VGDYAVYTGTVWARSSGATGTVTSVGVSRDGNALAITGSPVTSSGTINLGFSGDNTQYINGAGNLTTFPTLITSIGLTMPAAFNVSNSPLTANGTIGVSAAGYASQYIRGDGTLADFPTSGGGGSSVSYYFNGGTSQGTIGGTTYYEMSKTADTGTGVDFNKTGDGFIVAFLTDANDPNLLQIPAGNWDFEIYASMSSNGGTPELYAELYKYDGTTFTLIATSSHEILYDGINLNLYSFATAVPQTSLTVTDRLAIKLYADNSGGKTTTIHTQDSHLCQVITTFSTGLTALNGLTAQVQYFGTGTSGSDFNIVSSVATHTFNIPSASATARGLITTGTQTIAGAKTITGTTTFTGGPILSDTNLTYANSGYTLVLQSPTLSVNRTVTLPNGTGTLALISDLSGYVDLTTDQTIGGNKTFSNATKNNGGILLQNGSSYSATGYMNLGGMTNGLRFTSGLGISNYFALPSATGYTYTFPSATGTVALTSDISYPVTSVFGRTGAVVATSGDYTTTQVTEGLTNLYFTDARARAAISLTTTGSTGAATYNNTTGILNIPNYADQYVGTVTSVAMSVPTGLTVSGSPITTSGTLAVTLTAGYSIPTTANQSTWTTAYNRSLTSAAVTGTTTKTLTLNQQDGGTITASWTDINTDAVTSVFGRTGAVVATEGDYTLTQLGDVTITSPTTGQVLKYNGTAWINDTDANTGTVTSVAMTVPTGLSIAGSPITSSGTLAVTFAAGYSIPTNASQTTWDTAYTNRITSLTVTGSSGSATLISNVLNIPTYTLSGLGGQPLATNLTSLSGLTYASISFVKMTASGTFALDTNTYLTTTSAASTYLPLAGGSLTGQLNISFTNTNTTFDNSSYLRLVNTGTSTLNQRVDLIMRWQDGTYNGTGGISMVRESATGRSGKLILQPIASDGNNTSALTLLGTGESTFYAIDNTGNRTNPFNTITITTDNPNNPYEFFGGSILFNNRSYTHGIVSSSRIRSTIYDGGGSEGGGLIFETTPTAGGTLTPTLTLSYTGAATFSKSITAGGNIASVPSGSTNAYLTTSGSTGSYSGIVSLQRGGTEDGVLYTASTNYSPVTGVSAADIVLYAEGGGRSLRFATSSTSVALTISSTGASILNATDSTGNRTNPFNVLTITANNPNGPYNDFGGSILFRNQSYYSGVVDSARIRSIIYNGGGGEGGGFIFETTPTSGGTLTPTMTIKYTGNVGIGTSSPSEKLTVYGAVIRLEGASGVSPFAIANNNSSGFRIYDYNAGLDRMVITTGGSILMGNASDTGALLNLNYTTTGNVALNINRTSSAAGYFYNFAIGGSQKQYSYYNGSYVEFGVAGTVTATAFYESSDSRLKILIEDNYQTKGIGEITPKLYTKNGKVELGYYAQDFIGVLDNAILKGSDDMLSLSYREVHTAKIYALEQRIKELEFKLN